MKYASAAIVVVLWVLAQHAVFADSFETAGSIESAARKAQSLLPKMAVDGLIEAKRGGAIWTYSFNTKVEKEYCDKVKVTLKQINVFRTLVTVETVRVNGGILWSTTVRTTAENSKWEQWIKQALR